MPNSSPNNPRTPTRADRTKSKIRKILLTSPYFPRLYADVVLSSAPNSNEAKILAPHYQKIVDRSSTAPSHADQTKADQTKDRTKKDRTNMPAQPNVKVCTHIKVTGVRCGSPALRGEQFCYFHQRMLRTVIGPDSRLHHVALLENDEAIQASLMEVVNALIRKTIDLPRAELVLRALNTAVRNIRRARFGADTRHMVTRIPDYSDPEPTPTPAATPAPVTPAHVGTAAPGCPGVPEVSVRSNLSTKTTPALDPTRPKPPDRVKQTEAPKERKIAAHSLP